MHSLKGLEIRYERSFLLDLKTLEPTVAAKARQIMFANFDTLHQIYELPEFRQLRSSEIFYRFTFDRYLVSLEITGRIVKFLRILPKPDL